jgi:hypothetical protein
MSLVWGKASVNNWKLELETPKNSIKEMSDKEMIFSNKQARFFKWNESTKIEKD